MNMVIILIDDTLVLAERPVVAMIQMIMTMLHLMGFSISWDKSALILSQGIQLLGFVVNPGAMTSYVTARREGQEHGDGTADDPKARDGHGQRTLQGALTDDSGITGSPSSSPVLLQPPVSKELGVRQSPVLRGLNTLTQEELQWWCKLMKDWNGKAILAPKPQMTIKSDAFNAQLEGSAW